MNVQKISLELSLVQHLYKKVVNTKSDLEIFVLIFFSFPLMGKPLLALEQLTDTISKIDEDVFIANILNF